MNISTDLIKAVDILYNEGPYELKKRSNAKINRILTDVIKTKVQNSAIDEKALRNDLATREVIFSDKVKNNIDDSSCVRALPREIESKSLGEYTCGELFVVEVPNGIVHDSLAFTNKERLIYNSLFNYRHALKTHVENYSSFHLYIRSLVVG